MNICLNLQLGPDPVGQTNTKRMQLAGLIGCLAVGLRPDPKRQPHQLHTSEQLEVREESAFEGFGDFQACLLDRCINKVERSNQ